MKLKLKLKKIEIRVNQEKIDYINYVYNKEITYWKKVAVERVLNEGEEKELLDLAHSRCLLIRKEESEKTVNIDEIIFYLKSMYSAHNDEPRTFINDIPREEPFFQAITNYLKTFSKHIKEDENINLKNKCLLGGWILMASKVQKREFVMQI